jgi:hypothetical protein
MCAKRPNSENGGPSDWFNDTKPLIDAEIAKIREAAEAEARSQTVEPPLTFAAALAMMKSALKSHSWWRKRCDGTPLDNDIPVIAAEILYTEVNAASRWKAGGE